MSPHSEYRFEDSPGLNHSCGICKTPLNHPRAKKTCYGKHAEPCPRFHHTMFRIGRGTSCDACTKSNEQHLKRHREIAAIIKTIDQTTSCNARTLSDGEIHEAIHEYSKDLVDNDTDVLESTTVRDLKLEQHIRCSQGKPNSQRTGVDGILRNLGIDKSLVASPKKGVDLIARLENAIVQDITICANESREILKRRLGYYRYADQRAYHGIIQSLILGNQKTPGQMENGSLFHGISTEIDREFKDSPGKVGKRK